MVALLSSHSDEVVRPGWAEFWPKFRKRWNQGKDAEHVFIYGETGSGKTDLALRLGNSEPAAVAFVTKPYDPIMSSPLARGWRKDTRWRPTATDHHILLSPKYSSDIDEYESASRALFPDALKRIYAQRGWTIIYDEGMHMTTTLGMKGLISNQFYMGRSMGVTGILCSQRPAYIPVIVPQSCEHAFLSRSRRDTDLATLSELGHDKREMRALMKSLRNKHDFIYIDTQGRIPTSIINTHER